jgi:beta-mannosidase
MGQDGTSAGIWNHVELEVRHEAWLGVTKIQPILFDRKEIPGHEKETGKDADIYITAQLQTVRPGAYLVTAQIGNMQASSWVQVASTSNLAVLTVHMEHPKLWWTWDLGDPYLYAALITVADTQKNTLYRRSITFGVRSISLDEKTGEWRLNGVRFFIRGTNVVPDMWLAHYTPARIEKDISLLKAAHINGVRVCVHVNREELYDALDRAGIVAWQDFPLQWDYMQSSEFMQEAARQLRDMIRQFYNHPSIVTWVCQNESTAYNVNILDPFLAGVGREEDSSRPVRPVSHFREHWYEGWYGGDYHNYAETPGGPIISELGAQALPGLKEVRAIFGDAWPPDWYQKLGSFFQFQFVDCWPSITWSIVSYDRVPKAGYGALKQAYQPVLISADLDRQIWSRGAPDSAAPVGLGLSAPVWIINDQHVGIQEVTYEARLRGKDVDIIVGKSEKPIAVPADNVVRADTLYCTLPETVAPGAYQFVLTLRSGGQIISENSYPLSVVP